MFSIKDCGLMLEPQEGLSVQEIVSWAEYAERAGYGYIFRSDHILSTFGGGKGSVDSPECWVSLGAIAAKTQRIKFGPLVSPLGFRNPALLARMACTLHSYSAGRLQLAVGTGWYEAEYIAHGFEFPKFAVRRRQFIEALNIIRPLTEGKRVDFDGKYFSAHVECFPKPVGRKIHLILGGRSPRVVQTISEFADECNIFSNPDDVLPSLEEILRSSGRRIQVSQMGSFLIAESRAELDSRIQRYLRARGVDDTPEIGKKRLEQRGVLCGTVDDFVSQLNRRKEMGIEKFYFQILFPDDKAMVDTLTETMKNKF